MQNDDLILVEEFCTNYKIGYSFINSLQEFGLIEVTSIEQTDYITHYQLKRLEQLVRLHYDLDINLEGIDAITHLLDRVIKMQMIVALVNKQSYWEAIAFALAFSFSIEVICHRAKENK